MNSHSISVLEFPAVVARLANRCVSEPGRALAEAIAPSTDPHWIGEAQEHLAEMAGILERDGRIPMGEVRAMDGIVSRAAAEGAALSIEDLLAVLRCARTSEDVRRYIEQRSEQAPRTYVLSMDLDGLEAIQMGIARAIDPEGEILDRASEKLAKIRREMHTVRRELRSILDSYLNTPETSRFLQENIVTLRNGRYVLPVKGGDQRSIDGIVHAHSGSGATVFVEPIETVARNNALARLQQAEQREIHRILQALTALVSEGAGALLANHSILSRLDLFQAKALLMKEWRGVIPGVARNARLSIQQGRHPLLEESLRQEGRQEELIPLVLVFPDDTRSIVLTGPNTGGKTVALKTLGLFVLMAQSGMALPAGEGTTLPLFDTVHVDIGDEQSIENSLSSFSAHLAQMKTMLSEVAATGLVLVDELGAGTDPTEGAAISMALLEELHARGTCSLVTTHLGSLKAFVHEMPGMENASMAFDTRAMKPTYTLDMGLPGTSHAIATARRLGLPEKMLARAAEHIGTSSMEVESLLADLKERKRLLDERSADLEERAVGQEAVVRDLEAREAMLRERERRAKSQALADAKRYLDESRALVESHVKEIRTHSGERDSVRKARQAIETERRTLGAEISRLEKDTAPAAGKALESVTFGQYVRVESLGQIGRIVGEGNRSGRCFVEAGGLRLEVDLKDLRAADPPAPKRAQPVHHGGSFDRVARIECDLRGLNAEDAIAELDRFLDDAVLTGLDRVNVIHGIGTGVLRTAVSVYLGDDSRVQASSLDRPGGATTVEMR
ncbi:MAG: endonuclease MutS2 [Gemmatimonadetes bacterium]|nr:endonuclease MutS2 [Gemmatimonadota bacterium]